MFRTLSLSRSIPELDTTASMEEMERAREKQKLLNMSMDYGSYSPLTLTSTHPSRYSNTDLSMYDDPWGIQRHIVKQEHHHHHHDYIQKQQQQEQHDMYMMNNNDMMPPTSNPLLIKTNSIPINPFHTEIAPSAMLFPYDTIITTQQQHEQQQQQQSQTSLFDDMISPNHSLMSDESSEDEHEHVYKRQRGIDNNTIYIKQEQQEDQDILPVLNDVYEQQQQPQQQPMLLSQPSQHGFIDYTAMATPLYTQRQQQDTPLFTLETTTPFTLQTPLSLATSSMISTPTTTTTSSRRSSIDSIESNDSQNNNKRKRKTSTTTSTKQRKSQLIGTHAIENTGAPVKMAKYLHVDGLTTQVWLEHAIYEEAGIRTDIRMIMYSGAFNGVVVHAGDVGERIVCNRRSNISREFGQYASPNEKILIRIPSEHRPLGQTGNVLTGYGLIRFLQSKKMRKSENQAYRRWLLNHVYQILHTRPFTFPDGHPIETRTTPVTPFTEADFSH